jgi:hypothetical protein
MHIDLDASRGSFLQEFVSRPLLVSGHKFDIGVYTIITSVDPLRIYKYNGDVLFRSETLQLRKVTKTMPEIERQSVN